MKRRPCVVTVLAVNGDRYAIAQTRTLLGATWQVARLRRVLPHLTFGIRDLHLHPDVVRAADGWNHP